VKGKHEKAAAKKELKRLKDAGLDFYWSIGGIRGNPAKPEMEIDAEDIDDAPETAGQMLRQLADNVMRTYVQTAINEYKRHLKNIAKTGTTDLHSSE
jgi:hypothetical protein